MSVALAGTDLALLVEDDRGWGCADRPRPAFAITTAMYGRNTAPATSAQRNQPVAMMAPTEADRADGHRDQVAPGARPLVLAKGTCTPVMGMMSFDRATLPR